MTRQIDQLPNFRRAALLIATDNGIVNRLCSEERFLDGVDAIIGDCGVSAEDLARDEAWIGTLSEQELEDLCCGELSDTEAVLAKYTALHPGVSVGPDELTVGNALSGLLNDIFEYDYGTDGKL